MVLGRPWQYKHTAQGSWLSWYRSMGDVSHDENSDGTGAKGRRRASRKGFLEEAVELD